MSLALIPGIEASVAVMVIPGLAWTAVSICSVMVWGMLVLNKR